MCEFDGPNKIDLCLQCLVDFFSLQIRYGHKKHSNKVSNDTNYLYSFVNFHEKKKKKKVVLLIFLKYFYFFNINFLINLCLTLA